MNRKIVLIGMTLIVCLIGSGCNNQVTNVNTSNLDSNEIVVEEVSEEADLSENEAASSENTIDDQKVATLAVQQYFHELEVDELVVESIDFSDDINLVHFLAPESEKVMYTVRVDTKDLKVFMIQDLTGMEQLEAEMIGTTGIESPTNKDIYDYKYSLTPISKEVALDIANKFLDGSPMVSKSYELVDTKFEFKFDSQDKEYFVFEYEITDVAGEKITTFVKVDNYIQTVVEIIGM